MEPERVWTPPQPTQKPHDRQPANTILRINRVQCQTLRKFRVKEGV